jgi:sphingomyelin phosphodiesterase acid-like 3
MISFFFMLISFVIPAQSQTTLPWTVGDNQGTFLVMSDIHFDPYFDSSLVPQLSAAPVDQWESIFAGSALKTISGYGHDTNYPLFKSTLAEMARQGPYDYVLVSGDFISHHFKTIFKTLVPGADDQAYEDFVLKTMAYVSRSLEANFPKTPVYYCLGNNDSNYDDYAGVSPDSAFLAGLSKEWTTLAADPAAVKDFNQGGYYEVNFSPIPHHELVVLNDVFWSYKYDPIWVLKHTSQIDADAHVMEQKELVWFKITLDAARAKGDKVILMTHMPPGIHSRNASEHEDRSKAQKTFYVKPFLGNFLDIVATHRDVIDEEFCGHTHMDDFRVIQDGAGQPVMFTHVTPAVSPIHNNNPGFQVLLYNQQTGALKDMATYYVTNLDPKNDIQQAQWGLEYTFHNAYGYDDYNFASLLALSDAIENDPAVREKYVDFATVKSTFEPPVTMDNLKMFSCAHTHQDPTSYEDCYR